MFGILLPPPPPQFSEELTLSKVAWYVSPFHFVKLVLTPSVARVHARGWIYARVRGSGWASHGVKEAGAGRPGEGSLIYLFIMFLDDAQTIMKLYRGDCHARYAL